MRSIQFKGNLVTCCFLLFCVLVLVALMKDMSIPPGARAERLERNIISKEEAQSFINTEKQVENICEDQDPDEDIDTGARIYAKDYRSARIF